MVPNEVFIIPALVILTLDHLYEAWRWFRVAVRRPAFRRVLMLTLLSMIAASNLVMVFVHAGEAAREVNHAQEPSPTTHPSVGRPMA